MKRLLGFFMALLGICAMSAALTVCPSFAAEPQAAGERLGFEPGEVIVVYEDGTLAPAQGYTPFQFDEPTIEDVLDIDELTSMGVVDVEEMGSLAGGDESVALVTVEADEDVDDVIDKIERNDNVLFAQRNFRYYLLDDPQTYATNAAANPQDTDVDDPSTNIQYYLDAWDNNGANVRAAWDRAQCNNDVTIAILDTGCRMSHEDLAGNILSEYAKDTYNNSAAGTITDYVGHGTHVAGIAGAVANNSKGIAGASYNANIIPIKVFNNGTGDNAYADTIYIIRAYNYLSDLIDKGLIDDLHVINMSLGGYGSLTSDDYALESAIATFRDDYQIITVCAGGNGDGYGNPLTTPSYPSDYEECFAVTALNRTGANTKWSDYNKYKDISAPGENLYSTYYANDSSYTTMSGTSMASPLVAGIAALLWKAEPELTVDQAVEAMTATANPIDPSSANYRGPTQTGSAGAIDADEAVAYVLEHFGGNTSLLPSLRDAQVDALDDELYTGKEHTPKVVVTYDGEVLVEDQDYTVSYSDNVEVGTAKVRIVGTGTNYRGSKTASFQICYNLAEEGSWTANVIPSQLYTGTEITPTPIVRYKGVRLAKNVDYTITYENNIDGPVATATLTGMGNYRGYIQLAFTIVGAPIVVDKDKLQAVYDQACASLEGVLISEANGVDISPDDLWTTPTQRAAIEAALSSAKNILDSDTATQDIIDSQVVQLQAALASYEEAKKPGVVKVEEPVKPEEPTKSEDSSQSNKPTQPSAPVTPNKQIWWRLAGLARYDTMQAIVDEGWDNSSKGGTVVVATGANFKDALAAAGLAGLYKAPVILTDGKELSAQARAELRRLAPSKVYIAGGVVAISANVEKEIAYVTNVRPARLAGQTSADTSAKLALAGKGRWAKTAIIATNKTFKDALSVAPIAYAKHMPILLADNGKSLSASVLSALRDCGISDVIIVGGSLAVTSNVEAQLKKSGIHIQTRLAGANGVETSREIAQWGIAHGMSANYMGVATSQTFPDALAGAALCGYKGAVLVLADDKASLNATFPAQYKASITKAYVFGGELAVGKKTWDALNKATKQTAGLSAG